MANTELFVEFCVFPEFFFILIFMFGCRESAEKVSRNTFPTVILLRAK